MVGLVATLAQAAMCGAVRFGYGAIDELAFASLDGGEYFQIAKNLASHGRFSQSVGEPFEPDTWRTPGYPFFLAAVRLLGFSSPVASIIAQQILAAATMVLLYVVLRVHFPPARAWLAMLLVLVEPFRAYYSFWILATTLFTFLLVLAWLTWEFFLRRRTALSAAMLGAVCGSLVLVRPVGVLIPLVLGGALVIRSLRGGIAGDRWSAPVARVAAFGLAVCVVVLPWMLRVHRVSGRLALSHQGGIVLAYFKAAEVELWRRGASERRLIETSLSPERRDEPHTVWEEIDARACEVSPQLECAKLHWWNLAQGNRTSLDSFEVAAALRRVGAEMLVAHPLSTAACCVTRMGALLTSPLHLMVKPSGGDARKFSRRLPAAGAYSLLALAAAAGVWRRRRDVWVLVFPVGVMVALLVGTTPQLDPRFRVPMISLLVFLALLPRGDGAAGEEVGEQASKGPLEPVGEN